MAKPQTDFQVPITFRVPPALASRIQEAAEREDRTVSNWLRLQLKRITETEQGREASLCQ